MTVIIPVYNSATTLDRAIRSALDQSLRNIEVLVVDDGSSDGSLAVAQGLAEGDARVRVMRLASNGGKPRAMNLATAAAKGRWIAILDADDRYLPGRLQTLLDAGEQHGADLVADNQLHTDHATGLVVHEAFASPGPGRAIGLDAMIAHSDPGAAFDFGILKPMVRADFLRATQIEYHPDARLAEDFYFMLDLFIAGAKGWLVHAALYDWTLPFSPSARRWTATGSGAWRYDYRQALRTNGDYIAKFGASVRPDVARLLRTRAREYNVMIHYIDAQRVMAETGNAGKAAAILLSHPATWPLLARRVTGRLARSFGARRAKTAAGS